MTGTVLITGANRGIGLSFAKAYHGNGWTVFGTTRSLPEETTSLLTFLPQKQILRLDVSSEESILNLKSQLGTSGSIQFGFSVLELYR